MQQRRLIVIGLGHFGMSFLRSARGGEFEVIAIDRREDLVDEVASWVERAVVIDATDRVSLERVGIAGADIAVVSMGSAIDRSILAVLHLKQLGVTEICVKAVSDDHARILRMIGATRILHPERELAEQLAESLNHPSLRRFLPLLGEYAVVEMAAPAAFGGHSLRELALRQEHNVSVVAVGSAAEPGQLRAPSVDGALSPGDVLVLIGRRESLDRFEEWTRR